MFVFFVVTAIWIVSLTLHEFSHAYIAYEGGDTTVKEKGYLTFNPLRYANPMLSIILPIVFLMLGGIPLPGGSVSINHTLLRNRFWASGVALAGPAANLFVALVLALVLRYCPISDTPFWAALSYCAFLQLAVIVLNLLPIPGLDGFGIIAPFLPESAQRAAIRVGTWGFLLLFAALWFVPQVYNAFFSTVLHLAVAFGLPLELIGEGMKLFMFWRS